MVVWGFVRNGMVCGLVVCDVGGDVCDLVVCGDCLVVGVLFDC